VHLIFEKFGQLEARDSGRAHSTGLGLSFCKLAVEAHGGEIAVESEQGSGTTFTLTLQRGAAPAGIAAGSAPMPGRPDEAELTETERDGLRPIARELAGKRIYEVSALVAVLDRVEAEPGSAVERWKRDVETAIRACNEPWFEELTRL
jgi:hypothetical protein